MRAFSFKTFKDDHIIKLIVLASVNDLDSYSEHIKLADQYIKIHGGPSLNNYSNIDTIISAAQKAQVDAVWPGW